MAECPSEVESEISRRLELTAKPGSPNQITAKQLQEWAVEYLDEYDDELARFPDLVGQPRWNLWMMDARSEDALFAVLIFRADDIEFFCGTGNAFEIKRFAENDSPSNPGKVFAKMAARFSISDGSVRLQRQAMEQWFGRGW